MPRPLRIALYVVIGALVLVLLAVLLAPIWLEPIVHDRLEAAVTDRSDGQYALEIGNVDLSIVGGRVALEDTRLRLVEGTRARDAAAGMTGGFLVEGEVAAATVRGIAWWPLLTKRRVRFDSLVLERPRLGLTDGRTAGDGDTDNDSDGGASGEASGGGGLSGGGCASGASASPTPRWPMATASTPPPRPSR